MTLSLEAQVAVLAARSAVADGRDVGPNAVAVLVAELERLEGSWTRRTSSGGSPHSMGRMVTEDMRRRAVDALDGCRHSGQPWFKLLANEVVEIALNAALRPWRTNTTTAAVPPEKDHECDYTGPDDCCHICGADRPPGPGTIEAAEREVEDCYRAAVGSGAAPRKPGDAAAAVRELAKQYDELLTAFPWRDASTT